MKTIKIDDSVHQQLCLIKARHGNRNLSLTITDLIMHYYSINRRYNFNDGEHDGNK